MTPASAPQTIEPCFAAAHAFASCVSGTAGLLAKKDSMARELTAQLKRSEAGSPRPASAAGGGGGGADARAAPPAVGGKWPAQHETSVTPQVRSLA